MIPGFLGEHMLICYSALGSSCASNTMFSSTGTALSSLAVFASI